MTPVLKLVAGAQSGAALITPNGPEDKDNDRIPKDFGETFSIK